MRRIADRVAPLAFSTVLLLTTFVAGCASSQSGPVTGRGLIPTAAVQLNPEAKVLEMIQAGPAPFVDVLTRISLERRLRTVVRYCTDSRGAVVYSEIEKSSRNRTFDEQVRDYFAQASFEPFVEDGVPRPACTSSELTFKEPPRGAIGGARGTSFATRTTSYLPDCRAFQVVGNKVVCGRQGTASQEAIDGGINDKLVSPGSGEGFGTGP